MLIELLIIAALAAFIMETIDAGFGMGYGTVLSPLLIAFGFSPLLVVPSLLFSQAFGGLAAAVCHNRHRNADFNPKCTDGKRIVESIKKRGILESLHLGLPSDLKTVLAITVLGVLATILSVFVAIQIPTWILKGYIGILVFVIGALLVLGITFKFSLKKMMAVGLVASFNKGLSGGGFGPVTTGGQVVGGNSHKSSIGCTALSEVPICIVGFLSYLLMNGMAGYELMGALTVGAVLGAPLGAWATKKIEVHKLKVIIGVTVMVLGAWTLIKLAL